MGSSGGYFSGDRDLGTLRDEAVSATQGAALDGEVNDLLSGTLVDINDRDTEAVRAHLDRIEEELVGVVAETIDLRLAGSVSKHTYVDGLSDVDVLAVVGDQEPTDDPRAVLDTIAGRLRTTLPGDAVDVRVGTLAVTVTYRDGTEIQLLPAVSQGDRLVIPDRTGRGWSSINARTFSAKLTQENQRLNGRLVPTIKLAKSILRNFLYEQQLPSGYHVESMAINAFRDYQGPNTLKAMVEHFFSAAPTLVQTPIRDSTGQSVYVDEYLGEPNSQARKVMSHAMDRIGRRIRYATSLGDWSSIVGVD